MGRKATFILWGLIGTVALGVGGFFGIRYVLRKSHLAAFEDHVNEYVAIANGATEPGKGPPRGKMITIDKQENDIDWTYFDLPDELRADSPEEVGTIAVLDWGKVEVGKYSDGASAYVQTCVVTVVDKADKKVLGKSPVLQGGDPPKSKKGSGEGKGPRPTEAVVNYLRSLRPR
jgi:hypothetical protein